MGQTKCGEKGKFRPKEASSSSNWANNKSLCHRHVPRDDAGVRVFHESMCSFCGTTATLTVSTQVQCLRYVLLGVCSMHELVVLRYDTPPPFFRNETFSTATFSAPLASFLSWYTYSTRTSPCTCGQCQLMPRVSFTASGLPALLTSISTKEGVGSSSSGHHPVVMAPVALPGFTKNLPSISYASNLCVPPHIKISTSICRAAISKLSPSPGGIIVWPCVKPMRSDPCVTTFESGRFGESTSKSPFTICRSGAMPRRNSKVSLEVMFPRQRICPILPGASSFLNF